MLKNLIVFVVWDYEYPQFAFVYVLHKINSFTLVLLDIDLKLFLSDKY